MYVLRNVFLLNLLQKMPQYDEEYLMSKKILTCSFVMITIFCCNSRAEELGDPCDLPVEFCPEDIDHNGEIGIDDVLQILLHWGECGDGTYRPVGDINGDCCVEILDVLQIINRWDSDCIPKGACCMQDGSGCIEEMNEVECNADNGIWFGEDSLCSDVFCPVVGSCCFDDGSSPNQIPLSALHSTSFISSIHPLPSCMQHAPFGMQSESHRFIICNTSRISTQQSPFISPTGR